jgi:hypothetical protein
MNNDIWDKLVDLGITVFVVSSVFITMAVGLRNLVDAGVLP